MQPTSMSSRGLGLVALALASLEQGCNPYERRDGEFFAGSVDPAQFPAAYLGEGGKGNMAGSGVFSQVAATVKGRQIGYYAFPLPEAQAGADDPLDAGALSPPGAYVFDPGAASPFPMPGKCRAPDRYIYDPQKDTVRLDEQGNVFVLLPDDPAYVPLVAQAPVTSGGEPCQDIKSEETLKARADVAVGKPDGRLLAWAIIDPAAKVLDLGQSVDDEGATGLGLQRFGWYNHYLLAYLDGGYVPTQTAMGKTVMVAQELYFPEQVEGTDKDGNPIAVDARRGEGNDLLQAARGEAGYSPICHVNSYAMTDPMTMLPVVVDDVKDIDPMSVTDTGEYIYCLQVR